MDLYWPVINISIKVTYRHCQGQILYPGYHQGHRGRHEASDIRHQWWSFVLASEKESKYAVFCKNWSRFKGWDTANIMFLMSSYKKDKKSKSSKTLEDHWKAYGLGLKWNTFLPMSPISAAVSPYRLFVILMHIWGELQLLWEALSSKVLRCAQISIILHFFIMQRFAPIPLTNAFLLPLICPGISSSPKRKRKTLLTFRGTRQFFRLLLRISEM